MCTCQLVCTERGQEAGIRAVCLQWTERKIHWEQIVCVNYRVSSYELKIAEI